ncbi:MAG: hypothetical protein ACR2P2_11350, partial [Nakamurella sp.]
MTIAKSAAGGAAAGVSTLVADAPDAALPVEKTDLGASKRMLTTRERRWRIVGKVIGAIASILLVLFIIGPLIWLAMSAFSTRGQSRSLLPQ